ncbi:MAG TPA: DUF4352 domain-containing protein [Streptosporangiales bacterium]
MQQLPYTAPPPPQHAGDTPKNGLGTASLVTGILAIVFSWIPFAGFLSYPLALVGIGTGAGGIGKARRRQATNGGTATAGLVLSILGLVSVVLATVVYVGLLYAAGNAADEAMRSSRLPTTSSTIEPSAGSTHGAAKVAKIGQSVRDGKFEFTVVKVTHATHVGDSVFGENAQGRYTIVQLRIKNIGNESQSLLDDNQYAYDAKGRKFSADSSADIALSGTDKGATWFNEINPGNSVHGKIAFDMPAKAKAVKIELHDSMFSDGVTVSLR